MHPTWKPSSHGARTYSRQDLHTRRRDGLRSTGFGREHSTSRHRFPLCAYTCASLEPDEKGFLLVPGTFSSSASLPPMKGMAIKAGGHGHTHGPRNVSEQDQVCASVKAHPRDYGPNDERSVDGELERVLVLPPMGKGGYAAAKDQAGQQHELGRGVGEKVAAGSISPRTLLVKQLALGESARRKRK